MTGLLLTPLPLTLSGLWFRFGATAAAFSGARPQAPSQNQAVWERSVPGFFFKRLSRMRLCRLTYAVFSSLLLAISFCLLASFLRVDFLLAI